MHPTLEKWHQVVAKKDMALLQEILADDCVFHSPILHTPQKGKALVTMYLSGAAMLLANDTFTYVREVVAGNELILEFTCEVGDITINGVDMIRVDDEGKIVDFKVMVRPLKAVETVRIGMLGMLSKMKPPAPEPK